MAEAKGRDRERLRERLANHFVQRRRPDIAEWREGDIFPRRETRELTYQLSGAWEAFFNDVLDYCAEVVEADAGDERRQRLNFWGTLALLRCAGSSPVAAVLALRTRAGEELDDEAREDLLDRIFDGEVDALVADDVEPPAGGDNPALTRLIEHAERLAGQGGDPKLTAASEHVAELVEAGFNIVVFCRFIATAHYVARHLRENLTAVAVDVVTGEMPPDEREERVAQIDTTPGARVMVATDCLSEGINLQEHFDAVVHYDLSWNPTRHEQREGRVDRFGQSSPDGARHAPLRRQQSRGRRGAPGHPAKGDPHPRGARRPGARAGRRSLPHAGAAQGRAPAAAGRLRRHKGPTARAVREPLGERKVEGKTEPDRVCPATHPARRGAARVAQEPRRARRS